MRTLIRVPEVPNVSLRLKAEKMDSRVFSSAHTPVSLPELRAVGGSPPTEVVAVITVLGSLSWLPCEPGKLLGSVDVMPEWKSVPASMPYLNGLRSEEHT